MPFKIVSDTVGKEELAAHCRSNTGTVIVVSGAHVTASDARNRERLIRLAGSAVRNFVIADESPPNKYVVELYDNIRNLSRRQIESEAEAFSHPEYALGMLLAFRKFNASGIRIVPVDVGEDDARYKELVDYVRRTKRSQEQRTIAPTLQEALLRSLEEAREMGIIIAYRDPIIAGNVSDIVVTTNLPVVVNVGSDHALALGETLNQHNVICLMGASELERAHSNKVAYEISAKTEHSADDLIAFAKAFLSNRAYFFGSEGEYFIRDIKEASTMEELEYVYQSMLTREDLERFG